jgi:hypothetical protein
MSVYFVRGEHIHDIRGGPHRVFEEDWPSNFPSNGGRCEAIDRPPNSFADETHVTLLSYPSGHLQAIKGPRRFAFARMRMLRKIGHMTYGIRSYLKQLYHYHPTLL